MNRKIWTQEEITILRAIYPDHKAEHVAEVLGCKVSQVWHKATSLKIGKSEAFKLSEASGRLQREAGKATRFQPGQAAWNKGMKGLDIGGKETRFKPGRMPHNHNPIGHYRTCKDGYLQRKLTDTGCTRRDYVLVHRLLWRFHGFDLPKGHAIVFIDGDKTNLSISNLECLSRAELMRRNTIHNYPKEIAQLVQLRGAVNRQLNKRNKGARHGEEHQRCA